MTQYKSHAELKALARTKLQGNWGSAILTCLMPEVISFSFLVPIGFMFGILIYAICLLANGTVPDELTLLYSLYPVLFAGSIGTTMFGAGRALFFLNLACKKHHRLSDIFFGFRWQFKKTFLLATVLTLVTYVLTLPRDFSEILTIPTVAEAFSVPVLDTLKIISIVLSFIGLIVIFPVSMMLSQIFYLLLDFPKHSTKQILQQSIRMMKGNKWRLFCLNLSFLPLYILCVILTLGIGLLWAIPYAEATRTEFFLDLMNPQKADSVNQ